MSNTACGQLLKKTPARFSVVFCLVITLNKLEEVKKAVATHKVTTAFSYDVVRVVILCKHPYLHICPCAVLQAF